MSWWFIVRFNIPEGGLVGPSGSEGSDQGYESDQSRVSPKLLLKGAAVSKAHFV